MRLVVLGFAIGLFGAAANAQTLGGGAGSSPVATQPLAAGEVLLEVNATGTVTTRADLVTLTATASAAGANAAEARRNLSAALDGLAAAARANGVAAGDISVTSSGRNVFLADAMRDMAAAQAASGARQGARGATALPAPTAQGELQIRLRSPERLEALRSALDAPGAATVAAPAYALSDTRAARASARTQAIAMARADAESYAQALGMRVLRIVRVTDRIGIDFFGLASV